MLSLFKLVWLYQVILASILSHVFASSQTNLKSNIHSLLAPFLVSSNSWGKHLALLHLFLTDSVWTFHSWRDMKPDTLKLCGSRWLWSGQESAGRVKEIEERHRGKRKARANTQIFSFPFHFPSTTPPMLTLPWTPPPSDGLTGSVHHRQRDLLLYSELMALSHAKTYRSLCVFGEGKHGQRSKFQCGFDLELTSRNFGIWVSDRKRNSDANGFFFWRGGYTPRMTRQVCTHFPF